MYFLLDKKRKIAFGWSAKCGCTHIKKLYWYLTTNDENHELHNFKYRKIEYANLPSDYAEYTFIIIIRNPYERLVSGFLDKYNNSPNEIRSCGELRHNYKSKTVTFEGFVDFLIKKECKDNMHIHHFTPQTNECFDLEKLYNSKKIFVFDLNSINYGLIETLFQKRIPKSIIDFRGRHENKKKQPLETSVFKMDMPQYINYSVPTKYFYNESILDKVEKFYKKDFAVFKLWNFFYKRP
jgi:hypothetical protein